MLHADLTDGHWIDRLPWVMLGLHSTAKEDLGADHQEAPPTPRKQDVYIFFKLYVSAGAALWRSG